MHLRDWVDHMIISVNFENFTAYRRLKYVILECISKYHHIDQIEEYQEETNVLDPCLFDSFQELHPYFESLLLWNSHID